MEDSLSVETLSKTALPVLARVPRLEVGVVAELEMETPALKETRQYRIDPSLVPSIQLHQPAEHQTTEQLPSEAAPQLQPKLQEHVEPLAEEFLTDEAPPIDTSSPLRTLRQPEPSSTEERISAYLLRLQVMLKPLARMILLAALLTASALAYLLLEDNHVPLAPLHQPTVPTPNRPSEPRLTKRPTSAGASSKLTSSKLTTGPILSPSRPLSAIGPGKNSVAANPAVANKMVARRVGGPSSHKQGRKTVPKPTTSARNPIARNQVPTKSVPAKSQVAIIATVSTATVSTETAPTVKAPASYPNTGHPDVTPQRRMELSVATTKTAPPAKQDAKQDERPVAMAELTGSIQTPIKR